MPNLYARMTPLTNVVGRIDYISNPRRQKHLLATYDAAANLLNGQFWKTLSKESQAAYAQYGYKTRFVRNKDGEMEEKILKCCEGREIMFALSNALLSRMTAEEIATTVAEEFQMKLGLTVIVGVHLKHKRKGHDNLHVHVIFSERKLLEDPVIKIAERNQFIDAQGKRHYKKSEILDEKNQLLPGCRIIKKGEIYEQRYFSSVDSIYSYKAWMKRVKTDVILQLRNDKLKGDVEIAEFDYRTGKLPQQHIGSIEFIDDPEAKNKVSRILETNELIVRYNRIVDAGGISKTAAREYQAKVLGAADRCTAMRQVLKEIRQKQIRQLEMQGERVILAYRDWKLQAQLDAMHLYNEIGANSYRDMEEEEKRRKQAVEEAKKAFVRLQEQGDMDGIIRAAEEIRKKENAYKEIRKAIEVTQRKQEKQYLKNDFPSDWRER